MERLAYGVISENYKGYSAQVEGLLEAYPATTRRRVDADGVFPPDGCLSKVGIDLVGAGAVGLGFFRDKVLADPVLAGKYARSELGFVFTSDKFHDVPLGDFRNGITIIAPRDALKKYKAANPATRMDCLPVDLVSSPSREAMLASAAKFEASGCNRDAAQKIKALDYSLLMLLGGRVQGEDGKWMENDEAAFEDEAVEVLRRARGRNILVGTHGLRTFTRSDGALCFGPMFEFLRVLRHNMRRGQMAVVLSQHISGGQLAPVVSEIVNGDVLTHCLDRDGSSYSFILCDAIAKGADIYATAEQMTLPADMRALGADMRKMRPSYWAQTVPSNVDSYRAIRRRIMFGLPLRDAREVFAKYKGERDRRELDRDSRRGFLEAAGVRLIHR